MSETSFLTTATAVRFDAYTMGLGPWANALRGGEVHQWLEERDISHEMDQEPDGPAFLRLFTPNGALRCDVGDWVGIVRGHVFVLKQKRLEGQEDE